MVTTIHTAYIMQLYQTATETSYSVQVTLIISKWLLISRYSLRTKSATSLTY